VSRQAADVELSDSRGRQDRDVGRQQTTASQDPGCVIRLRRVPLQVRSTVLDAVG
jgi:hypothetical protein